MTQQHLDEIVALYKVTLEKNLNTLESILREGGFDDPRILEICRLLLEKSQGNLIDKWYNGRKYLRTVSILRAMSDYPKGLIETSLTIDAMVNILDDLLDEVLSKDAKALYIVEFIRLFSNFVESNLDERVRKSINNYFHKLITIAILENLYYSTIKNTSDLETIVKNTISVYDNRSFDIDIFIQMPLIKNSDDYEDDENSYIFQIARVFRAINLIKKDIDDFDHDVEHNLDTIITLLNKKNDSLKSCISLIMKHYANLANEITSKSDSQIVNNFANMIKDEENQVGLKLEKLLS